MNAKAPRFSVIMPVYNRQELVARAIESVLAQSDGDFELIAVDDASKDASWEVLQSFTDPRVVASRHTVNRGGSAARNTALKAARGELIAFLDSDDTWLPEKLAVCRRAAEQIRAPRWLLYHQYYIDSPIGRRQSRPQPLRANETIAEFLFIRLGSIQTSGVVLPRPLALEVMFNETLPRLQDWDFYLGVAKAGAEFVMCPEVLAVHDVLDTDNRISSKLDPDFLRQWIEARRHLVSDRAYSGYLANKVAPEAALLGRRGDAAALLLRGVQAGVTPPRRAAIELARLLLPTRVFDAVRRTKSELMSRVGAP